MYKYLIFLLIFLFCKTTYSQIDVEDITFIEKVGDTVLNNKGYFYRVLRKIEPDGTQVIDEYRGTFNYVETKYYARFDSLKRLVYLKYITKRSSTDGGGGRGIYTYLYDQSGQVIAMTEYLKRGFKYRFEYTILYDPETKKYTQIPD